MKTLYRLFVVTALCYLLYRGEMQFKPRSILADAKPGDVFLLSPDGTIRYSRENP
jgi:hypothetical protein